MKNQPWILNAKFDFIFILGIPFYCILFIFGFDEFLLNNAELSIITWFCIILCIDVAHVYSTLFNSYFKTEIHPNLKRVLIVTPIAVFILGSIAHTIDKNWFWHIIAYLAVFHFIRQQYGFVRLYSKNETTNNWTTSIEKISIYNATLYPLLYWHFTPNRSFNWFIDGDFFPIKNEFIIHYSVLLYAAIIFLHIGIVISNIYHQRHLNIPKTMIFVGTYISWYLGIVYFNSDFIFTLLNVACHGIPYIALVWSKTQVKPLHIESKTKKITYFLCVILSLAFLEEFLWDGLIWKEKTNLFILTEYFPLISNNNLFNVLVPLLSVPQITHYILDGYIWKTKYSNKSI